VFINYKCSNLKYYSIKAQHLKPRLHYGRLCQMLRPFGGCDSRYVSVGSTI